MTVTTSYPGIYLSESASLNFSVLSGATAIPAFIFYNSGKTYCPQDNIRGYDSWNEFIAEDPRRSEDYPQYYYMALRVWFMNGGGRCYLVESNHIVNELPKYSDITLLVANAKNADVIKTQQGLLSAGCKVFSLLDGPLDARLTASDTPDTIMADYPSTAAGAVFYPGGRVDWTKATIPPSVIAAVSIAKSDRLYGPWKAPANVVIDGVTPVFAVSDDLQGRFNQGKALNMIRTFPNVGTVVWGARTLDDSDNWRYIPVRRLFNMVERDIQRALNKLVFEPNSQPTWQRVKAAVDNYLYRLWQQGALAGNKEQDAWFVEIGKDITMTEDDINQGKLIVKMGLAAVRPAEFILLQFSQDIAQ